MAGWAIEWKSPVKAAGRWPAWPLLIFFARELQFEGLGSRHNGKSKRITARFPILSSLGIRCAAYYSASPRKASISQVQYPAVSGAELPRFRWLSE
jgi:hypothetical protein